MTIEEEHETKTKDVDRASDRGRKTGRQEFLRIIPPYTPYPSVKVVIPTSHGLCVAISPFSLSRWDRLAVGFRARGKAPAAALAMALTWSYLLLARHIFL